MYYGLSFDASLLQTLDEQELYTDEEFDRFEKEYEEKRRRFFEDGHAQPGEVNVSFDGADFYLVVGWLVSFCVS